MKETFEGGCDCGAVRYQARGPLRDVTNCHCGQCRRTHGHFAAYTNADKDGLSFIEDRGLKWYKSSDFARRGFCGECGASISSVHVSIPLNIKSFQPIMNGSVVGPTPCGEN